MKKLSIAVLFFLSLALAVAPPAQTPQPTPASLAARMPVGPLLYVQSPNFGALLHDWEGSEAKLTWLASYNYQVFSRSRLFLRLQDAQGEFAAAAGARPDLPLLDSVAGDESALALYDIGALEFLYITHLPAARGVQNALWSGREKFEPRKTGDAGYYVRTDPASGRVVAFAVAGDYLVLATHEDLMVGALALFSGKPQPSLQDEIWYKTAASAAGAAGDLRMVLNMPALVKSPHFRSYWIQGNITELKAYSAEVSDIHRSPAEIREDRVLIRASSDGNAGGTTREYAAMGEVLAKVSDQRGIYRAWSSPSAEAVVDLLTQKILAPRSGGGVVSKVAPQVALGSGVTGSESDLETRIDVTPLEGSGGATNAAGLTSLLTAHPLQAVLEWQWLQSRASSPFVKLHSAIVVRSSTDWDLQAVRDALRDAVAGSYTLSQIGTDWQESREGNTRYAQLDGLVPLAVTTQGPMLLLADSAETLTPLLTNADAPHPSQNLVYAAGFRHRAERENIVKLMRLIEMPLAPQNVPVQPSHEPLFFSENLASLSRSLQNIQSESVLIEDTGPQLRESVLYQLSAIR